MNIGCLLSFKILKKGAKILSAMPGFYHQTRNKKTSLNIVNKVLNEKK